MPKARTPRPPKEPLVAVAVPEPLYELLRDEAYRRNVTIVSLVSEALTVYLGVKK